MKNILILIPLMLLIAACNCDEEHPLVGGNEILAPDVFAVTGIRYTTFLLDNEEFEGIQVTFNREANPESFVKGETFFLEGEDVFFPGYFAVTGKRLFIPCGDFYCLSSGDCRPAIRFAGVRSLDDELLDGDRDGKAGGDFIEEVTAGGCPLPAFALSVFPDEDSLFISRSQEFIAFEVGFTLEADPGTVHINTHDANIRITEVSSGNTIPFGMQWVGDVNFGMGLTISNPSRYCNDGQACIFRLAIEESVRSKAGIQLDGDGDGRPGGDFARDYAIILEVVPPAPVLQLKLPGEDTTFFPDPVGLDSLLLEFEFSLPVGPDHLFPYDDVKVHCLNREEVNSSFYRFFWEPGSYHRAFIQFLPGFPQEICSTIENPDGGRMVVFKVTIRDRVQSTDGARLDGDYDGMPGGDAVKWFVYPVQ